MTLLLKLSAKGTLRSFGLLVELFKMLIREDQIPKSDGFSKDLFLLTVQAGLVIIG